MLLYSFSWFSKQHKYRILYILIYITVFQYFRLWSWSDVLQPVWTYWLRKSIFIRPFLKSLVSSSQYSWQRCFMLHFKLFLGNRWQFICKNGKIMNMVHNTICSPVWGWIYPSWQSDLFLQLLVSLWELLNGYTVLCVDIVTWNTVRGFRFKITEECCLQRNGHNGRSGHSCLGNFDTALLAMYLLIKLIKTSVTSV